MLIVGEVFRQQTILHVQAVWCDPHVADGQAAVQPSRVLAGGQKGKIRLSGSSQHTGELGELQLF